MTGTKVARVIFAIIAVLGVFFAYLYAVAGEWSKTIIPVIVTAWCTYRLLTMEEE